MTRFYNTQYFTSSNTNTNTNTPAPRLHLRLRDILKNPKRYFSVLPEGNRWFFATNVFMKEGEIPPGQGLIKAIEKAVNRKIQADYDAALAPLSTLPRQVWDWLWNMDRYATAWWCDPSWDFYGATLDDLSASDLRRLQGAIEAFQRLIPVLDILDWWTGSDTRHNTPWEDEAADDLRAAYLTKIKRALSAKLKAEAKARTLARYTPRPLTHKPFATALAGLVA